MKPKLKDDFAPPQADTRGGRGPIVQDQRASPPPQVTLAPQMLDPEDIEAAIEAGFIEMGG